MRVTMIGLLLVLVGNPVCCGATLTLPQEAGAKTPRACLEGHLAALRRGDWKAAISYVEVGESPLAALKIAERLKAGVEDLREIVRQKYGARGLARSGLAGLDSGVLKMFSPSILLPPLEPGTRILAIHEEGDRATASVESRSNGRRRHHEVGLERRAGRWLLVVSESRRKELEQFGGPFLSLSKVGPALADELEQLKASVTAGEADAAKILARLREMRDDERYSRSPHTKLLLERIRRQALRNPEYLHLPPVSLGVEDLWIDPDRIVIDIVDRERFARHGDLKLDPARPPIIADDWQIESFADLRAILRRLADPRTHAEKYMIDRVTPRQPYATIDGRPLYPSSVPLIVRCDQAQIFGWVQAVWHCCRVNPDRKREEELQDSPRIYKTEIATAGNTYLVSYLPTTPYPPKGGSRSDDEVDLTPLYPTLVERARVAEIILDVPKGSWTKGALDREVRFLRAGSNRPLGRCRGLRVSSDGREVEMRLDPADTLERVGAYLKFLREQHPDVRARINAHALTPFYYVMQVLDLMIAARYSDITYSSIPPALVTALERGALNDPEGLKTVLEQIQVAVPEAEPDPRDGTRRAVASGLAWLAAHQSPDGSWDGDGFSALCDHGSEEGCDGQGMATHDVGLSGLSLLAFLGAGQTHRKGIHKAAVRKGLKWLRVCQDPEGCFGGREDLRFSYHHAIATLAMAETYRKTRSGIWKGSAQRGIDFCLAMQNRGAGWRYGVRPGDSDTSVTAWMALALQSASMADLEVDPNALAWARNFIDEMTDPKTGRTGYTRPGERPVRAEGRLEAYPADASESLTGAGMIVRILSGEDPKKSTMLEAGAELIAKRLPRWEPREGRVDMYYWYWATRAMFQMGGVHWTAWKNRLKPAVFDSQIQEGPTAGSWDPVGPWGADGGRIYSTALMTLCLEVYYRDAGLVRDR